MLKKNFYVLKSIIFLFTVVFLLFCNFKIGTQEVKGFYKKNKSLKQESPTLLARFEFPISRGPSWDVLRKSAYRLKRENFHRIAVRICSSENLLLSIPSAVNNPFEIIEDIKTRFSNQKELPKFYILRSEDCISKKVDNMYATEVWAIKEVSNLPTHIEIYENEKIEVLTLGFNPSICSTKKNDYKKDIKNLIKIMKKNIYSYGIVIAYRYKNEKIDTKLQKRIKVLKELMSESNIPKSRYKFSNEIWHADDSICAGEPVVSPTIIYITKKN